MSKNSAIYGISLLGFRNWFYKESTNEYFDFMEHPDFDKNNFIGNLTRKIDQRLEKITVDNKPFITLKGLTHAINFTSAKPYSPVDEPLKTYYQGKCIFYFKVNGIDTSKMYSAYDALFDGNANYSKIWERLYNRSSIRKKTPGFDYYDFTIVPFNNTELFHLPLFFFPVKHILHGPGTGVVDDLYEIVYENGFFGGTPEINYPDYSLLNKALFPGFLDGYYVITTTLKEELEIVLPELAKNEEFEWQRTGSDSNPTGFIERDYSYLKYNTISVSGEKYSEMYSISENSIPGMENYAPKHKFWRLTHWQAVGEPIVDYPYPTDPKLQTLSFSAKINFHKRAAADEFCELFKDDKQKVVDILKDITKGNNVYQLISSLINEDASYGNLSKEDVNKYSTVIAGWFELNRQSFEKLTVDNVKTFEIKRLDPDFQAAPGVEISAEFEMMLSDMPLFDISTAGITAVVGLTYKLLMSLISLLIIYYVVKGIGSIKDIVLGIIGDDDPVRKFSWTLLLLAAGVGALIWVIGWFFKGFKK